VAAILTVGLTKRYGSLAALDSLDLEVPEGDVLGYLGPNGSGKTTTIRLLLGLIRATTGRAEIFGADCQGDPVAVHRRLAYVPGRADLLLLDEPTSGLDPLEEREFQTCLAEAHRRARPCSCRRTS